MFTSRFIVLLAVIAGGSAAQAGITLVNGGRCHTIGDGSTASWTPAFSENHVDEVVLPYVLARSTYSLSPSLVSIDAEHVLVGTGHRARTEGTLYFEVDEDTPYEISGGYAMTGYGILELSMCLRDMQGNNLFRTYLGRANAADTSFVLGEGDGPGDVVIGTLSGILTAGQTYVIDYKFAVTYGVGPQAVGGFDVVFGTTAVPSPRSAALGLAGTAVLLALRRGREPGA